MGELQTLARGLQILEILGDHENGLSSTDLATMLDVDKGTMSRLMKTLMAYRFVDRNDDSRRYYLGAHLQDLARRAGQFANLRDLTAPYLNTLSKQTGENAHVAVYSAPDALTIADVPSTQPLRVVSEVGRRVPLHCSAIGKCLLAFQQIVLPQIYNSFTQHTIVTAEELQQHLNQIRHQGYAVDHEELTLGVRGIAVPIRNREGRTIAALGLSGPSVRLTQDSIPEMAKLLMQSGILISKELGFTTSHNEMDL